MQLAFIVKSNVIPIYIPIYIYIYKERVSEWAKRGEKDGSELRRGRESDRDTEKGAMYSHDDVIKWKHFPRYWPFVRWIYRASVNSPHKGKRHGALMFSLICAWINSWVNSHEAGDLNRQRAHYDVTAMNNSRAGQDSDVAMISSDIFQYFISSSCISIRIYYCLLYIYMYQAPIVRSIPIILWGFPIVSATQLS